MTTLYRVGDLRPGDTIDGARILEGPFPAKCEEAAQRGWVYFKLIKSGVLTRRAVFHCDHKVPR